ncbi:MAG TPA: hypothetical protein VFK06_03280 [Candidatus Angelobacter sp.]|nr:hypothetical protein [Candidatus Angelobacter sp.]
MRQTIAANRQSGYIGERRTANAAGRGEQNREQAFTGDLNRPKGPTWKTTAEDGPPVKLTRKYSQYSRAAIAVQSGYGYKRIKKTVLAAEITE